MLSIVCTYILVLFFPIILKINAEDFQFLSPKYTNIVDPIWYQNLPSKTLIKTFFLYSTNKSCVTLDTKIKIHKSL